MPIAAFETMVILRFVFTVLRSLNQPHPPLATAMTNSNVLHRFPAQREAQITDCIVSREVLSYTLAMNDTSYTTAQTIYVIHIVEIGVNYELRTAF
jgi:hypothetical protein